MPEATRKCFRKTFRTITLRGKILSCFSRSLTLVEKVTKQIYSHSGWNNKTSPQQQSPPSNQQIPPGSMENLPQQVQQQQHNNSGRGNFRGNSRGNFTGRGRGRGGVNPNWNPHMQSQPQGQPQPLPGPMGIIQNAPPNMNQPPPKMVNALKSLEPYHGTKINFKL